MITKSGKYSCLQTGGTSHLGQTIEITPGKQYTFSFFYKTIITGSGNGCRIWCYWQDSGGNNLADPITDDIIRPSKYLKSDSLRQFVINITAPANAAGFYLEVRTYANSVTYWDEFVFEEYIMTATHGEKVPEVRIYPNPVHEYLIINNLQFVQRIDIQNITGNVVWSENFSGEFLITIPVSNLKSGLYLVRIYIPGKQIIRKILKK